MTTHTVAILDDTADVIIHGLRQRLDGRFSAMNGQDVSVLAIADVLVTQLEFPPLKHLPRLRWMHLLSAGYEKAPCEHLASQQWLTTHGSGPSVVPVAEWCLTMMLHFAHRVPDVLAYQQRRAWWQDRVAEMTAGVLRGRTVGIVGYGSLGREVGRLCKTFGMRVMASRGRYVTQRGVYVTPGTGDPEGALPDEWFDLADLPVAVAKMDYIVLGLRAASETRHIVNRAVLARCKPTAVLLNPSRGALVDEPALIEALSNHRLAGAALDVFGHEPLPADDPLRDAPNLLISPHCSPESDFFREEMINLLAENLRRFAAGRPLLNVVNRRT